MDRISGSQSFGAAFLDIAQFGTTLEELTLERGKPDPDPMLSPLPAPRAAEMRLALAPAGSDRLRLAPPSEPALRPGEAPRSHLALGRSAHGKLTGGLVAELATAVEAAALDAGTRSLMAEAIRRAAVGLGGYLGESIRLTEDVYARSLAASRG